MDVAWLGAEREWIASSTVPPQDQSVKEEEGAAQSTSTNSARPKFHRLPPLGPPLPSHASSSTPPTFVILTASHEVVLHHPISSNSTEKRWPLRTLRCGISGPEFGVWGLADGPSVEAAAGTSGGEGGKSGRRVRRGKILVRGEGQLFVSSFRVLDRPSLSFRRDQIPPSISSFNLQSCHHRRHLLHPPRSLCLSSQVSDPWIWESTSTLSEELFQPPSRRQR